MTEPVVNGYISWSIEEYKRRKFRDNSLWEAFGENFEGWTKDIFEKANKNCIRELRDLLRENGVYVRKEKLVSIAGELENVVNESEPHKWTVDQVKEQMRDKFNSRFLSLVNPSAAPLEQSAQKQKFYTQQEMTPSVLKQGFKNPEKYGDAYQKFEGKEQKSQGLQSMSSQALAPGLFGRELGNLVKIYEPDQKYSGGMDSFDLKLTIFYDLCRKSGAPPNYLEDVLSIMLKGKARDYYYDKVIGRGYSFETMIGMVKNQFETNERRQAMLSKWNTISLKHTIRQNENKSLIDCFESMLEELQDVQRGLSTEYHTENCLRDRLINACQGVKACAFACFKPASSFEALCDDIRSSILNYGSLIENNSESQAFFTDRKYNIDKQFRNQLKSTTHHGNNNPKKKCFVCRKADCWSTEHTEDERKQAVHKFKRHLGNYMQQYITEFEGFEGEVHSEAKADESQFSQIEGFLIDIEFDDQCYNSESQDCYLTSFGAINGINTLTVLNNSATQHALTRLRPHDEYPHSYMASARYTTTKFEGIMIDTGAARWSTAGKNQFEALKRIHPNVQLDRSTAGQATIKFGIGSTSSIGTIKLHSPIGPIIFHIVVAETPFLLCLRDMDNMKVKFDNLKNVLIQEKTKVPVIRKYGHPFILLDNLETTLVHTYTNILELDECHLTETELRQLHRRFGHPSVRRFARILKRSGQDFDIQAIQRLTKYCHSCQVHGKSPGRFKFTLRDDSDFNHAVYADVMYINGQPLLHVVDEATRFGSARWLKNMTAQYTWNALRACWIDVYVSPPDIIIYDAGSNFASSEFRQHAASMTIEIKEVPTEAYQSVGIVERYHAPLRRAYAIISEELKKTGISKDIVLQMAVKAVNDTAGPDGIVPTLLVFGAYPRMSNLDPPAPSISQRATAIKSAMKEVRRLHALRDVKDALRTRNGPRTQNLLELSLNSDVLVWRETQKAWTRPFKLLSTDGKSCTLDMSHGPVTFRTTVVKPCFSGLSPENPNNDPKNNVNNNKNELKSNNNEEQDN